MCEPDMCLVGDSRWPGPAFIDEKNSSSTVHVAILEYISLITEHRARVQELNVEEFAALKTELGKSNE